MAAQNSNRNRWPDSTEFRPTRSFSQNKSFALKEWVRFFQFIPGFFEPLVVSLASLIILRVGEAGEFAGRRACGKTVEFMAGQPGDAAFLDEPLQSAGEFTT